MIRIYLELALMTAVGCVIVIMGVHSFSVSEGVRDDDMSINRYGKD